MSYFGKDVVSVRELVLNDPVALHRWPRVVDRIVGPGADELRIKALLKPDGDYAEAVLLSLRVWQSKNPDSQGDELLQILRELDLNSLAHKIEDQGDAGGARPANVWFEVGETVHNFTGRDAQLESIYEMITAARSTTSMMANVICVTGLGGVGKSTLVREFAFRICQEYDENVVWIHGESTDSMRSSFWRLAKYLGLRVNEKEVIAELVAKVYAKLNDKKCLLIFDNVEDKMQLKEFLPTMKRPRGQVPHILVTTRKSELTPVRRNHFALSVFTEDEAVAFIQSQVTSNPSDCERLADKLQRLPLALQQAVAYIMEAYFPDDEQCVAKYLQELEKCAQKLLNDRKFHEDCDYSFTVLTAWTVSLNRIQTLDGGSKAITAIHYMSYLNPDLISVQFMEKIFEEFTTPSLRLLQKFSMINVCKMVATIHRLVQQVIRLDVGTEIEVGILPVVAAKVEQEIKQDEGELREMTRECASHGLHMFPYLLKHTELMWDHADCLDGICCILGDIGQYDGYLQVAQQSAQLYESVYGEGNLGTVKMKWREACAQTCLLNFTESMQILDSILEISQSELGDGDWMTLYIQGAIADNHTQQGHPQKAIEIYDLLFAILESSGQVDEDSDILTFKMGKVRALIKLGYFDEGQELAAYVHQKFRMMGKNSLGRLASEGVALGSTFLTIGQQDGAEMEAQTREQLAALRGKEHPLTVATYELGKLNEQAMSLYSEGRLDEATEAYQQVYEKSAELLGEQNLAAMGARHMMSVISEAKGDLVLALQIANEVYEAYRGCLGERQSIMFTIRYQIAHLEGDLELISKDEMQAKIATIQQEMQEAGDTTMLTAMTKVIKKVEDLKTAVAETNQQRRKEMDDYKAAKSFTGAAENILNFLSSLDTQSFLPNLASLVESSDEAPVDRGFWFAVGEPEHSFTGRESHLAVMHELLTIAKTKVCITGSGGIGKSSLARKYAFQNSEFYNGNVIWIDAASRQSMRTSFLRLAKYLKLPHQIDAQESDTGIVQKVYSWFGSMNTKFLFVFDSVQDTGGQWDLVDFLPAAAEVALELGDEGWVPYFLFTSRLKQSTIEAHELSIDALTANEATEFIARELSSVSIKNQESEELAAKLRGHPLALQLAIAYINSKHAAGIAEYLEKFDEYESDQTPEDDTDFTRTLLIACRVSLNRIKSMENGVGVLSQLFMLSFFCSNRISAQLASIGVDVSDTCLRVLQEFSLIRMIENRQSHFSIHRRVQELNRILIQRNDFEEWRYVSLGQHTIDAMTTFQQITTMTKSSFITDEDSLAEECVSHALHLLPFQVKYVELMKDRLEELDRLINHLMECGHNSECLSICQQITHAFESVHGPGNRFSVHMQLKLAFNHLAMGNPAESMTILASIHPVAKAEFGARDPLTLNIEHAVARAHMETGEHNKAVAIYDDCIQLDDYLQVSSPLATLGRLFWKALALMGCEDTKRWNDGFQLLQLSYRAQVEALGDDDRLTRRTKFCLSLGAFRQVDLHRSPVQVRDQEREGFTPFSVEKGPEAAVLKPEAELKPLWFDTDGGTDNLVGRQRELETLHEMMAGLAGSGTVAYIVGPPGIGKAALARSYALQFSTLYDGNVVWVRGESFDSLRRSFVRVAAGLRFPFITENCPQAEIVNQIYTIFAGRKCLFVFANVRDRELLKQFLPTSETHNGFQPSFLVTCGEGLAPEDETSLLRLTVLTTEDSLTLIQVLGDAEFSDKEAEELDKILQGIPLAIGVAVAHICAGRRRLPAVDYLREFNRQQAANQQQTVHNTVSVSLNRIREMDDGPEAVTLLHTLSYLEPDSISVEFVEKICDVRARPCLNLLQQFGLIVKRAESCDYRMHRLVQEVIRGGMDQQDERSVLEVLVITLETELGEWHRKREGTHHQSTAIRECISHALYLLPFQAPYTEFSIGRVRYLAHLAKVLVEHGFPPEFLFTLLHSGTTRPPAQGN